MHEVRQAVAVAAFLYCGVVAWFWFLVHRLKKALELGTA